MTPTPPPSRYIPARPEWLEGWCGPVEWLDTFRDPNGKWTRRAYGAGGMANGAPADRVRLEPSRPEVRDLLCRRLSLPDSHRIGEWAIPLAWWAGRSERAVRCVLPVWACVEKHPMKPWTRTGRLTSPDWIEVFATGWHLVLADRYAARGPETGDAGKLAADTAALAHDCALLTSDGAILLPPLVAGGRPILWSSDAR